MLSLDKKRSSFYDPPLPPLHDKLQVLSKYGGGKEFFPGKILRIRSVYELSEDFKNTLVLHQKLLCSYWNWAFGVANLLTLQTDKVIMLKSGLNVSASSTPIVKDVRAVVPFLLKGLLDYPFIPLLSGGRLPHFPLHLVFHSIFIVCFFF
jgi:hypothetical protein